MGEFDLPVAVIGAGPFGVSTAASLRSRGVEFRIFGSPMNRWRTQMSAGMFLESEGFSLQSSLIRPGGGRSPSADEFSAHILLDDAPLR